MRNRESKNGTEPRIAVAEDRLSSGIYEEDEAEEK